MHKFPALGPCAHSLYVLGNVTVHTSEESFPALCARLWHFPIFVRQCDSAFA
jgi:hypothetical protein